jgi:hypothetical protein
VLAGVEPDVVARNDHCILCALRQATRNVFA